MKKLFFNLVLYAFLIIILLEVVVRIFHLSKDTPTRFVDEYEVEKWVPNQNGFSVTGNRKQNFSEYRINNFGYNSYREYTPTANKVEVALVGDSFIEGFHQPYYNSIGRKIEKIITDIEVYEYGYAGYDFADQIHLINKYQDHFKLIDQVILGIKFNNDLTRDTYNVIHERIALQSPLNNLLKKSKLLVYSKSIGILDPPMRLLKRILNIFKTSEEKVLLTDQEELSLKKEKETLYLQNFKKLIATYGYDKKRFTLLLDSSITPSIFIGYLNDHNFSYIDFNQSFQKTKRPTTLIYDRHWNDYGRNLIADMIAMYLKPRLRE